MKFSLNSAAIYREMLAITALRRVGTDQTAGILTLDHLPGMRVLVRMAFADACMYLADLLSGCQIDPEDPQVDTPYQSEGDGMILELSFVDEAPTSGAALALRRQLEHAVALGALSLASQEGPDAPGSSRAQAALAAVRSAISRWAPSGPSAVIPSYY